MKEKHWTMLIDAVLDIVPPFFRYSYIALLSRAVAGEYEGYLCESVPHFLKCERQENLGGPTSELSNEVQRLSPLGIWLTPALMDPPQEFASFLASFWSSECQVFTR